MMRPRILRVSVKHWLIMMMQNSQGIRGVTLAYDDHAKESQGISGVTLAYDNDTKDFLSIRDVTFAHDNNFKDSQGIMGVTIAYDDDTKDSQGIINVTLAYDDGSQDIISGFKTCILLYHDFFPVNQQWRTPLMMTSLTFHQLTQG